MLHTSTNILKFNQLNNYLVYNSNIIFTIKCWIGIIINKSMQYLCNMKNREINVQYMLMHADYKNVTSYGILIGQKYSGQSTTKTCKRVMVRLLHCVFSRGYVMDSAQRLFNLKQQ